jgi:hypothetical protein
MQSIQLAERTRTRLSLLVFLWAVMRPQFVPDAERDSHMTFEMTI